MIAKKERRDVALDIAVQLDRQHEPMVPARGQQGLWNWEGERK